MVSICVIIIWTIVWSWLENCYRNMYSYEYTLNIMCLMFVSILHSLSKLKVHVAWKYVWRGYYGFNLLPSFLNSSLLLLDPIQATFYVGFKIGLNLKLWISYFTTQASISLNSSEHLACNLNIKVILFPCSLSLSLSLFLLSLSCVR